MTTLEATPAIIIISRRATEMALVRVGQHREIHTLGEK